MFMCSSMLVQTQLLSHAELLRRKTDTVFYADCLYRNLNKQVSLIFKRNYSILHKLIFLHDYSQGIHGCHGSRRSMYYLFLQFLAVKIM